MVSSRQWNGNGSKESKSTPSLGFLIVSEAGGYFFEHEMILEKGFPTRQSPKKRWSLPLGTIPTKINCLQTLEHKRNIPSLLIYVFKNNLQTTNLPKTAYNLLSPLIFVASKIPQQRVAQVSFWVLVASINKQIGWSEHCYISIAYEFAVWFNFLMHMVQSEFSLFWLIADKVQFNRFCGWKALWNS